MAPEHKETMQKGHAVSNGCFQAKTFLHGSHCPRGFTGQTLDLKHANNNNVDNNKPANPNPKTDPPPTTEKLSSFSNENYYFWSTSPPNFLKETTHTTTQSPHFDGCLYPANQGHLFPTTHWVPQVPFQMMLPQSCYPFDYVYGLQDFQYFVVIDFEATCDKEKNPHPQEIIEFPSVLVNSRTGQLEDCFQIYVRPTHNQMLTEFCKELTGIQQSQVDEGVLLSEALLMHDKWLEDKGIKSTNFAVVTWSNWDCRVMLESECRFKRIRKPPYFNKWINLKVPYGEIFGDPRGRTLKEAVELAGLTWHGRAHCGLDDAKNTARLVAHLMHRGLRLSITSSIFWQSEQQQQNPGGPPEYGPGPKWRPIGPHVMCYCGAASMKRVVRKPGPQRGSFFFGCGNWTANRGAICSFFKWASEAPQTAT